MQKSNMVPESHQLSRIKRPLNLHLVTQMEPCDFPSVGPLTFSTLALLMLSHAETHTQALTAANTDAIISQLPLTSSILYKHSELC